MLRARALLPSLFLTAAPFLMHREAAFAQARPKLSGGIELQEDERKKSPYEKGQEEAIAYVKSLMTAATGAAQGGSPPALGSDSTYNHLTGLYLYCTAKNGACPVVLEGLLEADILTAKLSNDVQCPHLRAFWKKWLENGFEERSKHLVATSDIAKSATFNEKERPKYLQCKGTIQQVLGEYDKGNALLTERFGQSGQGTGKIKKLEALLDLVQKKVPNVFAAIGAS